jgi:nicotinamide mononucleotide transporter
MLNALYYVPMQFWGFFVWSRHMNRETHEVEKRRMTGWGHLWLTLAVAGGTALYGIILAMLGGSLPFVDALSTVVSVIAMAISVYMYMEQWLLWVIVDVVTVFMWAVHFAKGGESMATLLMWIVYLGNAVVMLLKWNREAKERTQENAI